jgi:hypothetical protein
VDVARSPRAPSGGSDPPITTQGSLGPNVGPYPAVVDVPVPGIGNVQIPAPYVATPVAQAPSTTTVSDTPPSTLLPIAPRQPPPLPPAWTSTGTTP